MNAAVTSAADPAEADKRRRAVMNTIEKESLDKTGLRSDVVTLYRGGLYQLYRYKKYTDVRLVFAPEQAIAVFRRRRRQFRISRATISTSASSASTKTAEPAKAPHHLNWNPAALKEGDLVFVAGHPGQTARMDTVRHWSFSAIA